MSPGIQGQECNSKILEKGGVQKVLSTIKRGSTRSKMNEKGGTKASKKC